MNDPQTNAYPEAGRRTRGRVLVVDDEPLVGKSMARLLRDEHVVETVGSADEALERLRSGAQFDAILSDVMMPGGSGLDLHAALLREFPSCAPRVVFMTGGLHEPLQERIAQIPNVCLDKPVDCDRLRTVIGRTIALAQRGIE
jgi:CheY-like chemotaxis protein